MLLCFVVAAVVASADFVTRIAMAYASDDSIAEIFDSFLKIYNDKEGWEFISEKRGVVIDRKVSIDSSIDRELVSICPATRR